MAGMHHVNRPRLLDRQGVIGKVPGPADTERGSKGRLTATGCCKECDGTRPGLYGTAMEDEHALLALHERPDLVQE
jgi:hypothetical protein